MASSTLLPDGTGAEQVLQYQRPSSSATLSNVASSATNVTLIASNTSRNIVIIVNDSTQVLYVKYGATATSSSYTIQLGAGMTLIESTYTGKIDGIWASANGNARVTEMA